MRAKIVLLVVVLVSSFSLLLLNEYRLVHDSGFIQVAFCPQCEALFLSTLVGGKDVQCALYDNGKLAASALSSVQADVLTDDETTPEYGTPYKHSGLMHDKFCIINNTIVFSGSYNPTDGGSANRNNVLIIGSKQLAENYRQEFLSMKEKNTRPAIQHIIWINGTRVENYFCPSDDCEQHVLDSLQKAKQSIVFMTYSFTSDPIGKLLVQKTKTGVLVQGICDPAQNDEYSECAKLGAKAYRGEGLMHHKVFVIDNKTIITGSYNPTSSADRRNRENILIIESPTIAQEYLEEYGRVLAESQ